MSYHLTQITKGVLGELSKIQEELDEIKDAQAQNCKIMVHAELADLYGAVEAFAKNNNLTMDDLRIMNDATKRAFASGRRKDEVISTIPKDFDITRFGYIVNANADDIVLNENAKTIVVNAKTNENESFIQEDGFVVSKSIDKNTREQVGYRVKTYLGLIYFIQFTGICNTVIYVPNKNDEENKMQLNKNFTNVKDWTRVFNLRGDIDVVDNKNASLLNCSNQLYKNTSNNSFIHMDKITAYPISEYSTFLFKSKDCVLLVNSDNYFESIIERTKIKVTEDLHNTIMDIYNNCKILDDGENDHYNQRVEVL